MPKRIFLSMTLVVIFFLTPLVPMATAEEKPKAESSKKQAQVSKPASSDLNNITQATVKAGVLSCSSRINQVANFLTAGTKDSRAFIFLPPNYPDQQLISTSMEIMGKDDSFAYASASFAPNQANGCTGMYETVAYLPQKCTEVAEKNFGTFKKMGLLAKNISVLDGGGSTKVFLMPAGIGCVSIKKEIVR
jgi:hypothetical protein